MPRFPFQDSRNDETGDNNHDNKGQCGEGDHERGPPVPSSGRGTELVSPKNLMPTPPKPSTSRQTSCQPMIGIAVYSSGVITLCARTSEGWGEARRAVSAFDKSSRAPYSFTEISCILLMNAEISSASAVASFVMGSLALSHIGSDQFAVKMAALDLPPTDCTSKYGVHVAPPDFARAHDWVRRGVSTVPFSNPSQATSRTKFNAILASQLSAALSLQTV